MTSRIVEFTSLGDTYQYHGIGIVDGVAVVFGKTDCGQLVMVEEWAVDSCTKITDPIITTQHRDQYE